MLSKIGIGQKLREGYGMVIRRVIHMNIKVTCDEEWMRRGGE